MEQLTAVADPMPEDCSHESRRHWIRCSRANWCPACWRETRARAWNAVEQVLATTLRHGGHVHEQLPSGIVIDWSIVWVGTVPQVFASHRQKPDDPWGEPHAAFIAGVFSDPTPVAHHLRVRAEHWGFALFLEGAHHESCDRRDAEPARQAG